MQRKRFHRDFRKQFRRLLSSLRRRRLSRAPSSRRGVSDDDVFRRLVSRRSLLQRGVGGVVEGGRPDSRRRSDDVVLGGAAIEGARVWVLLQHQLGRRAVCAAGIEADVWSRDATGEEFEGGLMALLFEVFVDR